MQELAKILNERDIPFDAADRKIMCYAHIVDLSSKRVIDNLPSNSEPDDSNSDAANSDEDHVPTRNQVGHARSVVRAVRGSGMRRDTFRDVINNGNANKWFMEGSKVVALKELQLLHDVRTRWDSVYRMLNRLRELRPV